MYKLYGSPNSRLTRASWLLQEIDQPYEIVKAKPHSPELKAVNPAGKGPVLEDGDVRVIDSAAICLYLGEKHADTGIGPQNMAERGEMLSWAFFVQCDLEAPLWLKMRHMFLLPEEMRMDQGKTPKIDFANAVQAFEKRLGDRQFAMGDRFTAIDTLLGHTGSWARSAKFSIESDVANAYFDRVLAREALARAKAIENEM